MLALLRRIFTIKSTKTVDPEEIVEEFWMTGFHGKKNIRFAPEKTDAYRTDLSDGGLILSFERRNTYAWSVDPLYRYHDFVLETLIEFPDAETGPSDPASAEVPEATTDDDPPDTQAGRMAGGVLVRHISDSTFYSVLVSDRGLVRMDAIVNGTPIPILGWTESSSGQTASSQSSPVEGESGDAEEDAPPYEGNPRVYSLRIIARGTSFTLIVNDSWVAECVDDTIQAAGKIALAGQTWDARQAGSILFRGVALESRPLEVEALYTRWNQYISIDPAAHVNLARTLYAMGRHVPAILQLKQAWKRREPSPEEMLLAGRLYLAQRMYPEAEEHVRRALAVDPANRAANAELAGILYLQNRFTELETHMNGVPRDEIDRSVFLSNLEGHLLHWLSDYPGAAGAYHRAGELSRTSGLFFFHEGREWNLAGVKERAIEAWLDAARLFLASSEYDDLSETVALLLETGPADVRIAAIAGKLHYATGDYPKAMGYIRDAAERQSTDSAVWYLYGMMLAEGENQDEAIMALRRACELEPEYPLYQYRLAEALFFAGFDCAEELERALEIDDGNGWVYNLASLKALNDGDTELAGIYIARARSLLPDNLQVLINFAEIRRRQGSLDEALALFDQNDPDALGSGANLLVADERNEEAEDWYQRAMKRKPMDAALMTDRAANCLELGLINEADDLLGKALDIEPSPRIYQLISYLGGRKGEFTRSEIALLQGLDEFPENPTLLHELSAVYLATGKIDKASSLTERLRATDSMGLADRLEEEIRDAGTTVIACSACGRKWRIPRDIPPQGKLRITAQPPDDMPAGTCPSCGINYCIACAKANLGDDGRFRCGNCGQPLKLIDQGIIWLLDNWQEKQDTDA